ncbi:uncharacterized protein L201_002258 [Kwoniella dendrophila CBS 6074]|uniref:Uncharacterized protein n=1 Tax=Kwoniella dendrophila CBS 6074 TaxID=1295534 RepID=A0AAX4JRK3_9TREE
MAPRPIFREGQWGMTSTDILSTILVHKYEGKETESRDKTCQNLFLETEKNFQEISEGKFPSSCLKTDGTTQKSIKKQLKIIHDVKGKLNPNSTWEEYEQFQKVLDETTKNLISQVSTIIANKNPEKNNIKTKVESFDDIPNEEREFYKFQENIIDKSEEEEELLKTILKSTKEPTIWLVAGNSCLSGATDTRIRQGNHVRSKFDHRGDTFIFPSVLTQNTNNNITKDTYSNIQDYRNKVIESFNQKRGQLDNGASSYMTCDHTVSREHSGQYLEEEFGKIKSEESKLKSLMEQVRNEVDSSKTGHSIQILSGRQLVKYDPELAASYGYLDWNSLPEILSKEFDVISKA